MRRATREDGCRRLRWRRRFGLAACLSLAVLFPELSRSAETPVEPAATIDRIVRSYHQEGRFSGSVLVATADRVVYRKALGLADESWEVPNTLDTRFQIGSLTKQFTAALLLELQHQGKIDLDAPMTRYLPAYRADIAQIVTLRQLLGHTGGIPDFVRRPDIMEIVKNPITPRELLRDYCSGSLEFKPGSQFRYSNCGYLILGAIYERVAARSYAEGLAELVARAGMRDTGVASPRDVVPRLASGYVEEKGVRRRAPYIDWSIAFSSGSAYSTVEDLWRWRQALRNGSALWPGADEEIFSPRPFGYSFGWHVGRTNRDQLEEFLASDYDVHPASADMMLRVASHSGDLLGFHSCMTLFLDGSWTIILLDNHDSKVLPILAAEVLRALVPAS
ncbi:MAG TPA: serine hydrolase domain-containing protein [Thermoanaerobaculia bacterium]